MSEPQDAIRSMPELLLLLSITGLLIASLGYPLYPGPIYRQVSEVEIGFGILKIHEREMREDMKRSFKYALPELILAEDQNC